LVHLSGLEGNRVLDVDVEQRAGLIRRAHDAYAAAVRHRQPAMIHANDLGLLLRGYDLLHRRLSAETALRPAPAAASTTAPQRADTPPERRIENPLLRALRAVVTRNHAAACDSCREILQQTRHEAVEATALIAENTRLRQAAADAQAHAKRMTVDRDALICERDAALWNLRNAVRAERHRRSLPTGGR
jgi:hypothetical protein